MPYLPLTDFPPPLYDHPPPRRTTERLASAFEAAHHSRLSPPLIKCHVSKNGNKISLAILPGVWKFSPMNTGDESSSSCSYLGNNQQKRKGAKTRLSS